MTEDLSSLSFSELREKARNAGIEKIGRITKAELIELIEKQNKANEKKYSRLKDSVDDAEEMTGVIHLLPEGFGFMKNDSMASPDEYVYVSASMVQRFKLVTGDTISGKVRAPKEGEKYYIKRLIALPNETIEYRAGILYIDGMAVEEPYLDAEEFTDDFGPYVVPEGCYFFCGDNRNNSYDSRAWGSVEEDALVGKGQLIWWPFDRMGGLY